MPHLANQARRAVARGECFRPYPGILMARSLEHDLDAWTRATLLWNPNAVLLGRSAARVTHWPTARLERVQVSVPRLRHAPRGPVLIEQEVWPDALLEHDRVAATLTPEAAVLWCAERDDLEPVFQALREACVTVDSLQATACLAPYGRQRRWLDLAAELRDSPWSHPELDLHRHLRTGGLRGWRGNHRIRVGRRTYVGDVVFVRARLIVEVASSLHHGHDHAIEMDYRRHNALKVAGWRLLYVTPARLRRDPQAVLDEIRALLGQREVGQR
ncbi:endonuclease domain-containing protein [Aestuariimicrobium soli]|uniref:endonuclease domain-containing protein n=1 Tax=Aestuariimicrobium soli TaxID=2035834 RepID=UPI003EC0DE75